MADPIKDFARILTKQLAANGKLIAGGWESYRAVIIPPTAPEIQITETKKAFFAGAQHLFSSIMAILDPGAEPTEQDLQRMTDIAAELEDWCEEMKKDPLIIVPR